jgi:hypothetical protein
MADKGSPLQRKPPAPSDKLSRPRIPTVGESTLRLSNNLGRAWPMVTQTRFEGAAMDSNGAVPGAGVNGSGAAASAGAHFFFNPCAAKSRTPCRWPSIETTTRRRLCIPSGCEPAHFLAVHVSSAPADVARPAEDSPAPLSQCILRQQFLASACDRSDSRS